MLRTDGIISREELIKQIRLMANRTSLGETRPEDISGMDVCGLIMSAPALDVAPVVRCRNCESAETFDDRNTLWCRKYAFSVECDFYCASGKEKTGE